MHREGATRAIFLAGRARTRVLGVNEPLTLLIIALTFLIAGLVKGVIGLGLPTVALGLLTATIGLQPAMALMLAPSFVTNVWQAMTGGHGRRVLIRIWPFLVAATVTIWLGASALPHVAPERLSALLGVLLIVYAATGLARPAMTVPGRFEVWLGPVTGCLNGVLTGLTGSFVVPGVLYLQAIGLPRDQLIQAMGMLFAASTAALALVLGAQRALSADLGLLSVVAIVPALAGMVLGQKVRSRLSQERFRQVFFVSLLALGLHIVLRSLL